MMMLLRTSHELAIVMLLSIPHHLMNDALPPTCHELTSHELAIMLLLLIRSNDDAASAAMTSHELTRMMMRWCGDAPLSRVCDSTLPRTSDNHDALKVARIIMSRTSDDDATSDGWYCVRFRVCCDSFWCGMSSIPLCVWHDSCICVTWLIHMCDVACQAYLSASSESIAIPIYVGVYSKTPHVSTHHMSRCAWQDDTPDMCQMSHVTHMIESCHTCAWVRQST